MIQTNNILYKQIENYLLEYIRTRNLQPGDRLPPEREIGKLFNASHVPVRQATDALVKKDILVRVHGRGTFVKRAKHNQVTTNTVGILYWPDDVTFYQSPYYAAIMGGVKLAAEREGQKLVYRSLLSGSQAGRPQAAVTELLDEADALLIMEMTPTMREQVTGTLHQLDKPVVVIADNGMPNTIDTVVFDHQQNTRDAVRFLLEAGHRRIGFIYRESRFFDREALCGDKIAAYQQVLAASGSTADPSWVAGLKQSDEKQQLGVLQQLLAGRSRPTALCCNDDETAYLVYGLAQKLRIGIPADLSVVGYDDLIKSEFSFPRLTTVHLPFMELGLVGMRRVLEKLKEAREGIKTTYRISLPGRVVARESHKVIGNST